MGELAPALGRDDLSPNDMLGGANPDGIGDRGASSALLPEVGGPSDWD